ncbi:photosynthetic complex putative assembly protein PuhB [Methylobacterium sp. BTF04]|uniref:photosynthetic complex putative assembly protein PuhB n=1 Tax=Methylobacterium sp. BTF04 TaxID=2708300 RepID=UPI0032B210D7
MTQLRIAPAHQTASHVVPANAFDAAPGLPGPLPAGEYVLWQGRPRALAIAVRALHIRLVGLWFVGLALWATLPLAAEGDVLGAAMAAGPTLAVGVGAIALLCILGWLSARSTTYTITNWRVVMRVGIALPMTLNLPFNLVAGAGCHHFSDDSGDLALAVKPGNRIAYLHLWPHARPWHVSSPEPMMRSVPDAAQVSAILARALSAAREIDEETAAPVIRPRSQRGPRLATAS